MTRTVLIVMGAVCVALAVACGGGNDASDGGGTVDDTAREITSEHLSQMVLTVEDFGPEFAGFGADPKNGPQNLQTASEQDFDPAGERTDLEAAGFATGYRNLYQRPETSGIFFAGSGATLFATTEGAGGYVADSRKELTEYLGKTIGELTIKSSTPFDVEVADEATGANQEIDVIADDGSTVTLWYTAVLFRRGRLTGVAAISGISLRESEQQRLQDKVEALASTMNERMGSVLAGTGPAAAAPKGSAPGAVRGKDGALAAFGEGALAADVPRELVTVAVAVDIGHAFIELEDGDPAQRSRNAAGPNFMAGAHVVAELEETTVALGAGNSESQQIRPEYGLDHRVAGNGLWLAGGHVSAYDFAEFVG